MKGLVYGYWVETVLRQRDNNLKGLTKSTLIVLGSYAFPLPISSPEEPTKLLVNRVTVPTIADDVGCDPKTLRGATGALQRLVDGNYITLHEQGGERGRHRIEILLPRVYGLEERVLFDWFRWLEYLHASQRMPEEMATDLLHKFFRAYGVKVPLYALTIARRQQVRGLPPRRFEQWLSDLCQKGEGYLLEVIRTL